MRSFSSKVYCKYLLLIGIALCQFMYIIVIVIIIVTVIVVIIADLSVVLVL